MILQKQGLCAMMCIVLILLKKEVIKLTKDENMFLELTKKPKHRGLRVFSRTVTNVIRKYLDNIIYKYYSLITFVGLAEHIKTGGDFTVLEHKRLPYFYPLVTEYLRFILIVDYEKVEYSRSDYFRMKGGRMKWFVNESHTECRYTIIPDRDSLLFRLNVNQQFTKANYLSNTLFMVDTSVKDFIHDTTFPTLKFHLNFESVFNRRYIHTSDFEYSDMEEENIIKECFHRFEEEFVHTFKTGQILAKA